MGMLCCKIVVRFYALYSTAQHNKIVVRFYTLYSRAQQSKIVGKILYSTAVADLHKLGKV